MVKSKKINKIYTSYFYQIRNFKQNMIPISTAVSDPIWFRPPDRQEYFLDKRGIICGLRYEPLIVQKYNTKRCWGNEILCPYSLQTKDYICETMQEYRQLLDTIDFDKMIKAFEYCLNKFNKDTIVLMVYETPNNLCSERRYLQEYFNKHGIECKELKYPI